MISLKTSLNRAIGCIGRASATAVLGTLIGMATTAPPVSAQPPAAAEPRAATEPPATTESPTPVKPAPAPAPAPAPEAGENGPRYWTSQWQFDDIDVEAFANRLKTLGIDLGWQVSGNVTIRLEVGVPITSLGDAAAYRFDGTIRSPRLAVSSRDSRSLAFEDFESTLTYRSGRVTLEQLSFSMAGSQRTGTVRSRRVGVGKVSGQASMQWIAQEGDPENDQGAFKFALDGDDVSLQQVFRWIGSMSERDVPAVNGKLDFRIHGNGKLSDRAIDSGWNLTGSLASPSMRLAGWDLGALEHDLVVTATQFELSPRRAEGPLPESFKIGKVSSAHRITDDSLEIESLVANVFGGTVRGQATLPRNSDSDLIANFTIEEIRPLYRNPNSGKLGMDLSATITGDVNWRVPIARWMAPNAHRGTGKLSVRNIVVGKPLAGELHGKLTALDGNVAFQVTGQLLGGTIAVATVASAEPSRQWSDLIGRLEPTTLRFDGVSLEAVMDWWTNDDLGISGKIHGEASVDLASWQPEDQGLPDTSVRLILSGVGAQRTLSRRIELRGRVERDIFLIETLLGDYAGGSLRGTGRVYLVDGQGVLRPRTDLRLVASRIPLNPGLAFLGDAVDRTGGRVSVNATLAGYPESMRLRGNWQGRDLAALDVPIGWAHGGLAANINLRTLGWSVRVPSIRSRVGGGQLEGELRLASGRRGGVDLSSRWKTRRVDFFRLVNQLGGSSSLARGEISGEASLEGKSIRKLDDLAGRFDFQLEQTRGAAIPGLAAASQLLGPVSLASQSFDSGRARGVIGKGVVAVDEFWLGSDAALVQADGKVFLRSGRMDLKAIIATGDYRDIATDFAQLAQRYALRSFLPTSAVLSVSELLRDRTLVVSVGGTTRDPIVRLRPVETFREETARFLIREGQRLILAGITAEVTD